MGFGILDIGKSAINAAQAGLTTTGHNIANAKTPGYTRQIVVQRAASSLNYGFGYLGQGTKIDAVERITNELSVRRVNNSQASSSSFAAYSTQMQKIDNLLADQSAGLAPAMQDFFASLQSLSTTPADIPSRQVMLSSAQALASRFHSLDDSLNQTRDEINMQLTSNINLVNSYATQIASLNDSISVAVNATGIQPNDLLDQRDLLVNDLSKQIKTTIVKQDGDAYNVYVGNGLPLVISNSTFNLKTMNSPTDPNRLEVAYEKNGLSTILGTSSITGGEIGGLLQFRTESLDNIQNQLGQIAITFGESFNQQHRQGLDSTGTIGGNFFNIPPPETTPNANNTGNAVVSTSMTDVSLLTSSNYRLKYDGSQYTVTRLSDNTSQSFSSLPQKVDGLQFSVSAGSMNAGDNFLIKPTANGSAAITVAISNVKNLALGNTLVTSAKNTANTGSGTISSANVATNYSASPITSPINFTFSGSNLTSSPATQAVTVTNGNTSTTYPAGTPVPYTNGMKISIANISFTLSGTLNNGDQFSLSPNTTNPPGSNSNALLLNALRTKPTINGSTTSFENAFGQLVSNVGNKTREIKTSAEAELKTLEAATAEQQSESGVNLDEEATNLLRYQQAYQAAGKMMQIASQLFDVLLTLGR